MRRAVQRLSLLSVILTAVCAFGQTGHWVSHANDVTGLGVDIGDCGGKTAVFAREETNRLLFFDTNGGAWVEHDRPDREIWYDIAAEGDLALAVADTVAVVYNGRTSTAHELQLEGTLLRTDAGVWSFRCGESLAYVATDAYLYVFDAALDAWQQTAITMPVNFNRCQSGVGDDWVGVSLECITGNPSPCYAYSGQVHDFAYTDNGAPLGPTIQGALNHGFVESNNISGNLEMIAYSSSTNAFTSVTVGDWFSDLRYGASGLHGMAERTTFAVLWRTGSTWIQHFYGYDTRLGSWTGNVVDYDGSAYRHTYSVYWGGQYAATLLEVVGTNEVGIKVYSGLDGTIATHWLGFHGVSNTYIPGGTVFVTAKAGVGAWGLDISTGNWAFQDLPAGRNVGLRTEGENFAQFSSWDYVDPTMDLFAYHGPTNSWAMATTWDISYLDHNSGAHCMAHAWSDTDTRATFYSGHLGAYSSATLSDPANFNWWRSDNLGVVTNQSGQCAFYDARRNQVTVRDMDWEGDGIGQDAFVGVTPATQTGWGYSGVTGNWTSVDIGDTPRAEKAGRYVGWVATPWRSQTYWAFNAFHDEFVPLDTGGGGRSEAVGDQTMLVWHLSTVWAFDPEGLVAIDDPEDGDVPPITVPRDLALHPARPDPFNPETRVDFDLPRAEQVRLSAFDVRGRRVRTLVDGVWPAGTHEARWDGRDDSSRTLPSGTYLLRLETERSVVTRRVTLVK